jgi:hypothetical protein
MRLERTTSRWIINQMLSSAKALTRVRKSRARIDRTKFREWRAWVAGLNHWPRPDSLGPRNKGLRSDKFSTGGPDTLALVHLVNAVTTLPTEFQIDQQKRSYGLAIAVIKHFLGTEWVEKYMGPTTGKRTFLQVNFSDDDHQVQLFKAVDLAELLFNLQHVTNFRSCADRLARGDIESALAELDIARMLYINCQKFWFVEPTGHIGWDYDFEVLYPSGAIACLEVKCNLERQEPNINSVKNALVRAKKQLPDSPGVIIIKLPSQAIREDAFVSQVNSVTDDFLRNTGRVVSVKFYATVYDYDQSTKMLGQSHVFMEKNNLQSRFFPNHDWSLMKNWVPHPSFWNKMPPHWTRIAFFPHNGP